jgi:hypothetical protein
VGADLKAGYHEATGADRKREITSRIIRPGDPAPEEIVPEGQTASDRIRLVGELTRACLGWRHDRPDELRLQRNVVRIQRVKDLTSDSD